RAAFRRDPGGTGSPARSVRPNRARFIQEIRRGIWNIKDILRVYKCFAPRCRRFGSTGGSGALGVPGHRPAPAEEEVVVLQIEHARAIPISSRAELVYEALRDDIFNNRLRPGERVSEERIAQRLKVSRTPVREALKRLHAEGLVEITPHRGAVVRDPSGEELAELCTVREVLEGLAARLAARSISDVELYTLERLINEMDAAAREDRIDDLIQYNHQFHESIWLATRNR